MLSGDDILDQVADLDGLPLTKDPQKKIKISHKKKGDEWNKKSIFFDLPYWKTLLLRHNFDVIHIEKNICDNILGTILDVKRKTKDTLSTQLDLQQTKIQKVDMNPSKTLKYEMGQASKIPKHELIQPGPFEYRKAKKLVGVAQGSKGNQTSQLKSKQAKKVIEVAKDATRNETSMYFLDVTGKIAEKETFDCDNMNDQRDNVLQRMRKLWSNWRGSLHKNMKSKSLHEVLKYVSIGVDKSDWEWLVKEHFLSEKFKAEIQELVQSEPSLTNIEVVKRCFGPQCKTHAVGFGGGITT
ncbi:hypothetical protein MTR67_018540 [Solanum verrucosum]|uniref:Uncharacterized protein n=1 Tax=Solanum verrucosum TaxID=315347 RepID=A0AAF0QPZ7_SOLVR|nr:hypothetical protein MTR67_018540 [Solanum verrucosum]